MIDAELTRGSNTRGAYPVEFLLEELSLEVPKMATPKYFGLAEIKVSRNLNCHSKQTYCGNTSPHISLDFIYSINMLTDRPGRTGVPPVQPAQGPGFSGAPNSAHLQYNRWF
jgi:hypothetical protein